MGSVVLLFAIFAVGYFVGVWTAILVLRRPQQAYEEELARAVPSRPADPTPAIAWPVELEA